LNTLHSTRNANVAQVLVWRHSTTSSTVIASLDILHTPSR
jgi:hypothetical protein